MIYFLSDIYIILKMSPEISVLLESRQYQGFEDFILIINFQLTKERQVYIT